MKSKWLLSMAGAALCLAAAPAALAQMSGNNILYTPTVNLSAGTQNTYAGSVGGVFLTSNTVWPSVNWLGYFDKDGDGLANSHEVSLWYTGGNGGSTASEVAHATIPAGTAAPLFEGYRWVQLSSKVDLWYGSWYTISAQTDGVDTWGDLASGSELTWDAQYVGGNDGWSRAGRSDTAESWPNSPANQVGTSDSIYPAANMGYNLAVVPEPGSLSLLAVGTVLIVVRSRKQQG